jgi:diguanylate cyclase (GGDEF)-like protein
MRIGERIRAAVENGKDDDFPEELKVTSSFGFASVKHGAATHHELIEQADWALYTAKNTGRNRVVKWDKDLDDSRADKPSQAAASDSASSGLQQDAPARLQSPAAASKKESNTDRLFSMYMKSSAEQAESQLLRTTPAAIRATESINHLPDRVLLFDRVDQAIKSAKRKKRNIAIMVLNFDALQRVSDAMGMSVAEKLAKTSIQRLKCVLRDTDTVTLSSHSEMSFTVSRLDSNQVVILLTDLKTTEIVTSILHRIFSAYERPVEVESNEYYLNTNIGVSLYPFDGQDSEILLRNASSAMRESRESNDANGFRFYADEINQRFKQKIQLEADLHRAMDRDEFELYYQPKVDLKTGTILGMEALLRWKHAEFGFISPAEFIPIAEQTGLIEEIGLWVIRTTCRQIRYWKDAGLGLVTVAVNLSPVQFRSPKLARQIINIVRDAAIPPHALEIEITEGVIMQDIDSAVVILQQLHSAGLHVSLDDFGTGYSSLSYLKRFPLSKIKIDRSFINDFVHDVNEASIVSAIIAMGHSLGLQVVAEGVETMEQLQLLQDLQCDEMQGYLVSKPLPKEEAKELLKHPGKVRRLVIGQNSATRQTCLNPALSPTPGLIGLLNNCPDVPLQQVEY